MKNLLSVVLLVAGAWGAPANSNVDLAPLYPVPENGVATGAYIVVLKEGSQSADDVLTGLGIAHLATSTYSNAINGFAGRFDEATLNLIRASPFVEFVEPDLETEPFVVQHPAPYNLAIDSEPHRLEPNQQNTYNFYSPAGFGVNIYILDTGININNNDFGGRAHDLISYYGSFVDANGHGTNVAGIAGGAFYGIAKSATLFSVKVLPDRGSGSYEYLISGIDYSVSYNNGRKGVINMSLGGGYSHAVNNAVQGAFNKGMFVVSAAGNNNTDACTFSPASSSYSFTVGAINKYYQRAPFSNYGQCVNIFAPGVDITAAGIPGPNDISTISGTSQAAPAVAGIAAYFMSVTYGQTPIQMAQYIDKYAQHGLLSDIQGSPNILVNNGYHQGQPSG